MSETDSHHPAAARLLAQENLVAWEIAPDDVAKRSPIERARLLSEFGIRRYAYIGRSDPLGLRPDVNSSHLDARAEISAMEEQGIEIYAWYVWINSQKPDEDAAFRDTLEMLHSCGIHPTIWVSESYPYPRVLSEWKPYLHERLAELVLTGSHEQFDQLSNQEHEQIQHAFARAGMNSFPNTAAAHAAQVTSEAERIARIARMAGEYGFKVDIYNHRHWFGMIENQLEILARLRRRSIASVGLCYNFIHAIDELHNDAASFHDLWPRMMSHVNSINVAGMRQNGTATIPSKGDYEFEMLKTIVASGWSGPIGFRPFQIEDARKTIEDHLSGFQTLRERLAAVGAGDSRPGTSNEAV